MRRLKTILPPVLGAAALVVLILYMSGTFTTGRIAPGKRAAPPGLPPPATTFKVKEEPWPVREEAVGTVRSRVQASVAPQITGQVIEVTVDAGDGVDEGQVLVRLSSQEYRARLEQARSSLASAVAGRTRVDAALTRVRRLFDQNATTAERLEEVEAEKGQADAAVEAAEQRVKEAAAFLEHTTLRCPMKGVVADRLADPGDLAYPGKPLIVVHSPTDLRLEAPVREGLIARVNLQKAADRDVEVYLTALDVTVRGRITEVLPSADPVSRTFLVRVALPPTDGLFPGMFGKLRIELDPRDTVMVPAAAVVRVGQLATVRVEERDRWVRRFVTVGPEEGDRIEVLSGLRADETIGWE